MGLLQFLKMNTIVKRGLQGVDSTQKYILGVDLESTATRYAIGIVEYFNSFICVVNAKSIFLHELLVP